MKWLTGLVVMLASIVAQGESFNLATFNVRFSTGADKGELNWVRRVPRMAAVVRRHGFDVFGIQEGSSNIVAALLRELPDFAHAGKVTSLTAEGVGVFYRRSRFRVVEEDFFWLSDTPDVPGSRPRNPAWRKAAKWNRNATALLLEDKTSGRRFRYVNTHLNHKGPREIKCFELDVIFRRVIDAARQRGECVVLTGDMNARFPDADTPEALRALSAENIVQLAPTNPIARVMKTLKDSYLVSETPPQGPFRTLTSWKDEPISRIDYVFVSPEMKVRRYAVLDDRIDGQLPSDHYPVMTTLELPE
ncbi:MAG: endonuclease/exonuclease/phosphatase family protein [bacterium]|nr:endonuclease/exonuclease/phosphatase family protein [bacterium]